MHRFNKLTLSLLFLSLIVLTRCQEDAPRDRSSLLIPSFTGQRFLAIWRGWERLLLLRRIWPRCSRSGQVLV
jgi:hypothetical protein